MYYQNLPLYTRVARKLRFPSKPDQPFLLVYFSENSLFLFDYPRLNIPRVDVKHVVVPITKLPLTRLTSDQRKIYKQMGLLSYSSNMRFPPSKNLFYDVTPYLQKIDQVYQPSTYRQRVGTLIQNLLFRVFSSFPSNYRKVFVYAIDLTKPFNQFINRKIFPILFQIKEGILYFDDFLLVLIDEEGPRYRLLIKDGEFKFPRILSYLKKVKVREKEETVVQKASGKVMKLVRNKIQAPVPVIHQSIKNYLLKRPKLAMKISNDELTQDEVKRLAISAVLFSTSGDLDKANRLAKTIPEKKVDDTLQKLTKQYKDDFLKREKSKNESLIVASQLQNVEKRVDGKTPEHIFEKRRIDFETNLKKDLADAFRILEKRDIPLKLESVTIKDIPQRASEIRKSDEAVVIVKLKDKHGNVHEVKLKIPKIDPRTGTFRINGERKCLINQIVLNPISFPKPYNAKFESSYSSFHIYSKRTRNIRYLEIFVASFHLPLMIFLSYAFGFDETVRQYGLKYQIMDNKPPKDIKFFCKVPSSYIVFSDPKNDVQEELISSFIKTKIDQYQIEAKFGTKEYFNELIVQMTGRVDSTYLITNILENIINPVTKQVLINKQLPFQLPQIIEYMATKCVAGYKEDRNDLSNQRVRNSEVLVHIVQKLLLSAYTEYQQQYLSGNKDAKFNIPENAVLSKFNLLEIVQNMEFANPVEEMATITKVSPVGKTVGGIPDKRAIQLDARNVHPSYFGNIDPLDTAEGGNIGITQQLTVNAYITSSRGLFGIKPINEKEKSGILSTSASLIPFVENNEGARILMATNQAKQMLPLKNPEPPICQSGYESLLVNVLSDNFIKRSPCVGKVESVSRDNVIIRCSNGKKKTIDISPVQLKSGSGKNTLSTFTPLVKKGDSVKAKTIIAEGSCISKGTISLGKNLACCYMPYKGYNFEDSITINERLIEDDTLTSLHGVDTEFFIDEKDKILFISDIGKETKKGEPLVRKIPGVVSELLNIEQEEEEELDVYGGQIILKSPGGKIVDIEVFCNVNPDKFPQLKELIQKTDRKYKRPKNEKYTEKGIAIPGIKVVFKIEQELRIGIGDKLCNRFGNKGIISLIEKDEFMPRTPWGETVDIILNPLGVLGRMNVGQLYELYCGLISKHVSKQILQLNDRKKITDLLSLVMKGLDPDPNKKFSTQFVSNVKKLSQKQFNQIIEQTKDLGFFPIVIPPFQAPTYKQILPLLKKLGLKTAYHLYLPEYGVKTKQPVPFGYSYIAKLEHIGSLKAHSRATGPLTQKYMQPTAGKRREGGQRVGEGDTWALVSYNAPTVLTELFTTLSDDMKTKNEIVTEIIQTGQATFRQPKMSPTRDLLRAYFTALLLE